MNAMKLENFAKPVSLSESLVQSMDRFEKADKNAGLRVYELLVKNAEKEAKADADEMDD